MGLYRDRITPVINNSFTHCVFVGRARAYENDCGECVGGSSGNDEDEGFNVCGQCESDPDADPTSCEGCDGVANR